ncbi:MAG: hypothetical protein R3296_08875 [Oleiphilaceae bacterium]|nr:hypothetical protein [Oleiphilaceae bacterium]
MRNPSPSIPPLPLFPVGLFIALLPLVTIHTTYLIAATQGFVDWCIPYLQSCTSISATGRNGLGYFVFRGAMIPALVLIFLFWCVNHAWLRSLGYPRGRGVIWLALPAALFLLMYTLSLGHAGDTFNLLRRIGVTGYVGMTGIAQITLGAALYRGPVAGLRRSGGRLLGLSGFTLGVATLSVVLDGLPVVNYDVMKHSFEWILVVLLNLHGVAVVWVWRQVGLVLALGATRGSG